MGKYKRNIMGADGKVTQKVPQTPMIIERYGKDPEGLVRGLLAHPDLSWGSKGIGLFLMMAPDASYETMLQHGISGREHIRSMIQELIIAGYIKRVRTQDEQGRMKWITETVIPQAMTASLVQFVRPIGTPEGDDPGYVYVVHDPIQGLYKIGKTRGYLQRFGSLVVEFPNIVPQCIVAVSDHTWAESLLHEIFRVKHDHLDWFDLDQADVDFIASMTWVPRNV